MTSELDEALDYHARTTGQGLCVEYLLIDGVNDAPAHAHDLVGWCAERERAGGAAAFVNLIPYNPTSAGELRGYATPPEEKVAAFHAQLRASGLSALVRWTSASGRDANGACGQLVVEAPLPPPPSTRPEAEGREETEGEDSWVGRRVAAEGRSFARRREGAREARARGWAEEAAQRRSAEWAASDPRPPPSSSPPPPRPRGGAERRSGRLEMRLGEAGEAGEAAAAGGAAGEGAGVAGEAAEGPLQLLVRPTWCDC